MQCPICEGVGGWTEYMEDYVIAAHYDCPMCSSTGKIPFRKWLSHIFWINIPSWLFEWYVDRIYPIKEQSNE